MGAIAPRSLLILGNGGGQSWLTHGAYAGSVLLPLLHPINTSRIRSAPESLSQSEQRGCHRYRCVLDLAWVLVIHAAYGDLGYPARQADYPRASDCTPTTWTNTALLCCLRLSFCSPLHTPLISAFASLCSCPVVYTSSLGLVPSFLLYNASSLFYDAYLRFRCHRTGVHSCFCFCCFCSNACLQCCLKC